MRRTPALALGVLVAGVSTGLIFPLLPALATEHDVPLFWVGAVLAANRVGRLLAAPALGRAVDGFGARRVLLAGLTGQVLSAACFVAGCLTGKVVPWFLAGRLVQGPAGAAVTIAALTLAVQGTNAGAGGLVRALSGLGLPIGVALGALTGGRALVTLSLALGAQLLALTVTSVTATPEPPLARAGGRVRLDARLARLAALQFTVSFTALGLALTLLTAGGQAALQPLVIVAAMAATTALVSRRFRSASQVRWSALGALLLLPLSFALGPGVVALAVLGSACGTLSAAVVWSSARELPSSTLGRANGWIQLAGDVGGALGPLVATTLLSQWGGHRAWLASAAAVVLVVVGAGAGWEIASPAQRREGGACE